MIECFKVYFFISCFNQPSTRLSLSMTMQCTMKELLCLRAHRLKSALMEEETACLAC